MMNKKRSNTCEDCKHCERLTDDCLFCNAFEGTCCGDNARGCHEFVAKNERNKQTNGDHIRQMSNEELVMFLFYHNACFKGGCGEPCDLNCHKCWREWLNKEVEE